MQKQSSESSASNIPSSPFVNTAPSHARNPSFPMIVPPSPHITVPPSTPMQGAVAPAMQFPNLAQLEQFQNRFINSPASLPNAPPGTPLHGAPLHVSIPAFAPLMLSSSNRPTSPVADNSGISDKKSSNMAAAMLLKRKLSTPGTPAPEFMQSPDKFRERQNSVLSVRDETDLALLAKKPKLEPLDSKSDVVEEKEFESKLNGFNFFNFTFNFRHDKNSINTTRARRHD